MATNKKKNQKKAKDQPAKDIAKAEQQKKADELSEEQLDKVAGGRVFRITNVRANAAGVPAGLDGVGQLQAGVG